MKCLLAFMVGILPMQMVVGQVQNNKHFLKYKVGELTTEIRFLNKNTVRVVKYRGTVAPDKRSLVVLNNPGEDFKTKVSQKGLGLFIQSPNVKVVLNKKNGAIAFFNSENEPLLAEVPCQNSFEKVNAAFTEVSQSFRLTKEEAIYGLGQHQTGRMNQRNQTILLKQRNMDIAVPFIQSTKGYGIYWDNYASTIYKDKDDTMRLSSEAGNCIDYYFIAGSSADAIISGYRNLTGKVPMFPLWSFGYIQSRERYQSQEQLVGVVKKYRDLKVPLDGVVQDWQYWGDNDNWNATAFDNPKYSNPDAMIDSIHQMHARILISVWPSFGAKSAIYKEMNSKGMLFDFPTYPTRKDVKVYDAFNPAARDIYWTYLNKNLFSKGIDGWWLDATEPEQKNTQKDKKSDSFNTSVIKDTKTFLGDYKRYTNSFPFETVNGIYSHQRASTANKRVFILTRSAFAGQQRDASMVWSGDITASWQTLKRQIPAALNYSLSGLPYWNADIGGFISMTNYPEGNKDLQYRELYIRWLQFAVFTGMLRTHGTNTPREIYQFGGPGDISFDVIKKYIGWRYQMEPYIYSAAWKISSKNASLMRALVMDYPKDKKVFDIGSEYLFGNSILVAPVTDSIFGKNTKELDTINEIVQNIYLPEGDWYDYNTDQLFTGHQTIKQSYTLSRMPVFVKAGAIIPLAPVSQYSSIKNFKDLTIKVYPGKDAEFDLYEDEGDNYNYEKGKYSVIHFVWDDHAKALTIIRRSGSFNSMIQNRIFEVKVAGLNANAIKRIEYDGDRKVVHF